MIDWICSYCGKDAVLREANGKKVDFYCNGCIDKRLACVKLVKKEGKDDK